MPPTDAAPPACIVVTGVQGSGKTAMANAILASFLPDTARGTPSESTAPDGKDTVDVTTLLEGAALGAPSMPSTERISAQESADLEAHPDGVATANRVATRGGVLPTGVTTRVALRTSGLAIFCAAALASSTHRSRASGSIAVEYRSAAASE